MTQFVKPQFFQANEVTNFVQPTVAEAFALDIRSWMKKNKKNYRELGKILGVSDQMISDVLNCRNVFSGAKMLKMLDMLGKYK
jgi:predicted XRE-type DNA-binding protein